MAERGGVDEIEMAPDDFGESVLGMVPDVAREQFQIGIAHVQKDNVAVGGNRTRNFIASGKLVALRRIPPSWPSLEGSLPELKIAIPIAGFITGGYVDSRELLRKEGPVRRSHPAGDRDIWYRT